ncbi:MAG: glycosyltransferase family 2 protein [Cyanophyceae cyanobacterium]
MSKLVSVIIPCFNAEKWLREAISSVLAQTHPQIEIIVIDDGSSDRSLEIIKSYGNKITWHSRENGGANSARNLGFSLSHGDYIQYLDADDYLLPAKIAKQVQCLQAASIDFVYGDWRYQHHLDSGEIMLGDVNQCGPKDDFLQSLLANERWSNLAPILLTRSLVSRVRWDESLPAAQDRDFLFSIMLAGAKCAYQSGCDSIYRIHEANTVSRASKLRWFQAHCLVMEKAEQSLLAQGLLSQKYQQALAKAYLEMGKEYVYSNCGVRNKFTYYAKALDKACVLAPHLVIQNKSKIYKVISSLLGYRRTEKISYLLYSQTRRQLPIPPKI